MSFSSRSSKKHYRDSHQGSKYYKREGFLSRIFNMFGSFSSSRSRYNKHHSHYSDQRHYSDHGHYSDHNHHRRRYKSSWS